MERILKSKQNITIFWATDIFLFIYVKDTKLEQTYNTTYILV